jgi:hypothetical protein
MQMQIHRVKAAFAFPLLAVISFNAKALLVCT